MSALYVFYSLALYSFRNESCKNRYACEFRKVPTPFSLIGTQRVECCFFAIHDLPSLSTTSSLFLAICPPTLLFRCFVDYGPCGCRGGLMENSSPLARQLVFLHLKFPLHWEQGTSNTSGHSTVSNVDEEARTLADRVKPPNRDRGYLIV
jgi:hypothetical protein